MYGLFWVCEGRWGWGHYFGWVGLSGGRWDNILGGCGWVEKYFGWVGVGGGKWGVGGGGCTV